MLAWLTCEWPTPAHCNAGRHEDDQKGVQSFVARDCVAAGPELDLPEYEEAGSRDAIQPFPLQVASHAYQPNPDPPRFHLPHGGYRRLNIGRSA